MKKINKYIIAISSTILAGIGITAGVLSSSHALSPSAPTLNLELKNSAKHLSPKEFVSSVMFNGVVDRQILDNYVSGIPNPDNLDDENLNEITRNFIVDVKNVSYVPDKDTDYVNISIYFQSRFTTFSKVVDYKVQGMFFESQHMFENLIATPTGFAKNVLPNVVNLTNYKNYINFSVEENFPNLETTASFSVKQITYNQTMGSVNLKLLYKHNSFEYTKDLVVNGFKTTDASDNEQLNEYLLGIRALTNDILVPTTLPSEVNEDNLVDYVTFHYSSQLNGVQAKVHELTKIDAVGILKVKMYYKYHNIAQTKEFNINGFQTTNQRKKLEFDKFCDSIQLRIKPEATLKYIKASMVNVDNFRSYVDGIIDNPLYQITILEIIPNDADGSINVKLKITGDSGSNEKIINQQVFGFYIPAN